MGSEGKKGFCMAKKNLISRRTFLNQSAAYVAGAGLAYFSGRVFADETRESSADVTISGKVFLDEHGDGELKSNAKGMADVVISDGYKLVRSDKDGNYELHTSPGRLVFVILPKGYRANRAFYQSAEDGKKLNFPLVAWPESNNDAVRFAQITDIHIRGEKDVEPFSSDLEELNRYAPKLTFVLASGDLADNAAEPQFDGYQKALTRLKMPLFNVIGNHDMYDQHGDLNYRKHLGPPYYAFNVGNCHFIVLNSQRFDNVQKEWVQNELQMTPASLTRIATLHFLPDTKQLEWFAALGIQAVLSGHWHGSRVVRTHGVLDLNTPPFRFGGIDRSPRGFRLVEVSKGQISNELIYCEEMRTALAKAKAQRLVPSEHVAWVTEIGGPAGLSSPVISNGIVVIGMSDRGNREECGVSAFDTASGKKLWHFKTDTAVKGSVAVGQDRVFALSQSGTLYTLDLKTGTLISQLGLKSEFQRWEVSTPVLTGDTLYVGNLTYFAAINSSNSKIIWEQEKPKVDGADWWPSVYGRFIPNGDQLLRSTHDGVFAFDRNSGKELWKIKGLAGTGAIHEGILYAPYTGSLAALKCTDGEVLWKSRERVGDTASVPAIAADRVVVGTADGRICAFSLRDGALLWSFQTGKSISDLVPYARGKSDVTASPLIVKDTVYVGASDGVFYALSADSGKKLWSYDVGVPIASAAAAVDGGVFAASYDGALYRFNV